MRLTYIIALYFLILLVSCQSNSTQSVFTISNRTEDFQKLDHLFKDKQVIFLGEPSHGDGTIFEARVDLIKYLFEHHGFKNIVFESNFYDAEKINDLKANGTLRIEDFEKFTFDIWGKVTELDDLWEFMISTPEVYFRGMDFQPHLLMSEYFLSDLEGAINLTDTERDLVSQILGTVSGTSISKRQYLPSANELEILKSIKIRLEDTTDLEPLFRGMSAIQNYLSIYSPDFPDDKIWAKHNFRDSLMAEQLDYHKTNHHKVVVWLASAHSLERPELIDPTSDMDSLGMSYTGYKTVGKRAKKAYGKTMLNIAFTGLQGSFRDFIDNKPYPVDLSTENSIEAQIIKQTGKPTYVNLSKVDTTFKSGILGYEPMMADWAKNFDGLIIFPLVEPSTIAKRTPQ